MTVASFLRLAARPAGFLFLAALASAQAPKVGKQYERSDLGFRVKTPAEWELIGPQPGDPHLLAKFDPTINKYVQVGPASGPENRVFLGCYLVQFDRRKAADGEKPKRKALKDVGEWIHKAGDVEFGADHKLVKDSKKELSLPSKIPAYEVQYATEGEDKLQKRVYAVQYALSPDLDIAIVFTGPGSKSKWPKYEAVFEQMAKSFSRIETDAPVAALGADAPLRDRERAKLQTSIGALGGGWKLYESPNYFIVTPHEDKAFIEELMARLEAIRAVYEVDYPYEKAKELRAAGEAAVTGLDAKAKAEREQEKAMEKAVFGDADPREMSRCSVVRVLTDQGAYHSYGGPPSTAGYWSATQHELVIFDDQAGGGRRDTWVTLNHEAFHQYIFYLYGNISPHSWYNEGTGDFYSGYEYKNKRFTLKANQWRMGTVKQSVQEGKHVPLKDFVRFTQQEYYTTGNKYLTDGFQNYAQGWSFIYFLRTGKKNFPKNWDPAWENILTKYFTVLATSGDLDQAVTEAFQGIDFDALEAAWKAST